MGVYHVEPADWQRILSAFKDNAVSGAYFLDGGRISWESNVLVDGGPLPDPFWERLGEYVAPPSSRQEDIDF